MGCDKEIWARKGKKNPSFRHNKRQAFMEKNKITH